MSVLDSFDEAIDSYGPPHLWDRYTWFLNKWRLIAEAVACRVLIDVALRCPSKHARLKKLAADKFPPDFGLASLDHTWPGQWCFEYDWDALAEALARRHPEDGEVAP